MSLSTQGNAWNVITPSWRNYKPVMPSLAGPGVTFTTTGNPDPGYSYIDGNTQKLYLIMMQGMGGSNFIPFLATDFGLWVQKDIETYGALMTASDPISGSGGGAIEIGHGFTSTTDDPKIILSDTIGGGSGATATDTVKSFVVRILLSYLSCSLNISLT